VLRLLGLVAPLLLLALLVPLFPGGALAKGGTNIHEFSVSRAGVPAVEPSSIIQNFRARALSRSNDARMPRAGRR